MRVLGFIALGLLLIYLNHPSQNENKSASHAAKPSVNSPKHQQTDIPSRSRSTPLPAAPKSSSAAPPQEQVAPTAQGTENVPHELVFSLGHPHSFDEAKRTLRRLFPKGTDVYCGCSYDFRQKQSVSLDSCGWKSGPERRSRIEWEHVVPASYYGKQFQAWTQGAPACERSSKVLRGRNCAREASLEFRRMEADLYNLLPAVGELNQARSDLAYGDVPGEPRAFGPCNFEIKDKRVEPPENVQGDLARITFYMDARYPDFGIVNGRNQKLLERWADADPLDDAERSRIERIEAIQGNSFFIGRNKDLLKQNDISVKTVRDSDP